ncbi:hypothetical protein HYH02_011726 [Chlamydomonas schloesseri]|uniref:Glycosyl transferase CAP10 domain-containing protein n=1 Tax=Chlamydomonas schloesseri TaxID=2026947 RepID=A0A835SZE5_9CHLO|nr:hypothetical protein HYH02_011726 [Chlamydomonas schloesseri]|eukprot:KAG2436014.1 hypothetical protein HYH02_011726 [Chlamydomonas schloesseri]
MARGVRGQLALLLVLLTARSAAAARNATLADLPFLDDPDIYKDVLDFRRPPPGYLPARTDEEWEPIYRDNLFEDLRKFKEIIAEAGGRKLSLRRLGELIHKLMGHPHGRQVSVVVAIRGGRLYRYMPSAVANSQYLRRRIGRALRLLAVGARALGLALPDCVFAFNLHDTPVCRQLGGCRVPLFSLHKRFDAAANRSIDSDVLLPHLGHAFNRLLFFPWAAKEPRALLRATMQNSMERNCTRVALAKLSASGPGSALLDAGFVENKKQGWAMPSKLKRPYVGMSKHARYKFLINADGHVSSSRLGYIMQTNSVVLRERSPWIEYYYRSLVHGVHVLQYDAGDVLQLLTQYNDPARDAELRTIANTSQHFVAKFLTPEGKVRYTVRALQEYAALFEGMTPGLMRKLAAGGALIDPPKEGGGLIDVTNAAVEEPEPEQEPEQEQQGAEGRAEEAARRRRRNALQESGAVGGAGADAGAGAAGATAETAVATAETAEADAGTAPKKMMPIVLGAINLRALLVILTNGKLGGEDDGSRRQGRLHAAVVMAGRGGGGNGGGGGGNWRT